MDNNTVSNKLKEPDQFQQESDIMSNDGLKVISRDQLSLVYDTLNPKERPITFWDKYSKFGYFMSYNIESPIISFSSKSLVIAINQDQVCKISFSDNPEKEISNHKIASTRSNLFPEFIGQVDFNNGWKGIVMERIRIYNQLNFSAGELHKMKLDFVNQIDDLHNNGIIHNDLGFAKNSDVRINIIISEKKIRLIDCEKVIIKSNNNDCSKEQDDERNNIHEFIGELGGYGFCYLT